VASDGGAGEAAPAPDGGALPEGGPFAGPWSAIPGAPPSCTAVVAQQPAASLGSWTWSPCPSGRAGCRVLNIEWTPGPGKSIYFRETEPVRLVQGRSYMTYSRIYPTGALSLGEFSAYVDVVQPIDGAPLFAVGVASDPTTSAPGCSFWTTFGEAGIGFLGGSGATTFVSWAPWSAPTSLQTKVLTNMDLGIGPQGLAQDAVLGSQFYIHTLGPESVVIFDPGTQKAIVPSVPQRLPGAEPWAIPDGALVLDYTLPYSIDLLRQDGTYARLVAPTAPQVVTSIALDRSSGNAFVWVESDNQANYVNSNIWTAPYATDPSALVRRKVALIGSDTLHLGGAQMVANRGVALNLVGPTLALLTSLADGKGWSISAEPGRPFVRPVWVDDSDVWLTTADGSLKNFQQYPSGLVRIARSSLGAANVSPGI
jgi:hypothetical protein